LFFFLSSLSIETKNRRFMQKGSFRKDRKNGISLCVGEFGDHHMGRPENFESALKCVMQMITERPDAACCCDNCTVPPL
jgi:hypothetical protein